MIIDTFTHTWESPDQLGRCILSRGAEASPYGTPLNPRDTRAPRHTAACEPVDVTIVLGFTAHRLAAEISNDAVAQYVSQNPKRLVGLAGIDPTDPKEAIAELKRAREELGMPGLAVAPAAQGFHPTNSQAMLVYAAAAERNMPVIFHTGVFPASETMLEFARPVLLDEVAREFPDWPIVIAHLGFPWVNETIELLAKHRHVYGEISWMLHQPWQAYQTLLSAYQYGVMDKLLFGSGFPQSTAAECIEALYSINHLCQGTNLPTIPREQLRGIVERDSLSLLGIPRPTPQPDLQSAPATTNDQTD